jgi:phosphatidylethanolamine/phosphatidyl-N-methylethanolamine N-methyltransferase
VKRFDSTSEPNSSANGQQALKDAHQSLLYFQFAHLYDAIFKHFFYPHISRTVSSLNIPAGAPVLELGVGTGLSLAAYPKECSVLGIDYSADMLKEAQKKIEEQGLHHVNLRQMNAMDLDLPSSSFQYVMAFHVVTVVPESLRLIKEAQRVCVPGGTVVIINHFRKENGFLASVEQRLEPFWRYCGWRTITCSELLSGNSMKIERIHKGSPPSLFTTIIGKNMKDGAH